MHTKKEKLEIIKDAAAVALESLEEALSALEAAEQETDYTFSYGIMQQLKQGYIGTIREQLDAIADGEDDDTIMGDLEDGTEGDEE